MSDTTDKEKQLFEDLHKLIEKAKNDHNLIKGLKTLTVGVQDYELASNIREYERKTFPQSQESLDAIDLAKKVDVLFRMGGVETSLDTCWLLYQLLELYRQTDGGNVGIDKVVELIAKKKILFTQ